MHDTRFLIIVLAITAGLFCLFTTPLYSASPPLILRDSIEKHSLSYHLDILEDEERKWSIDQVTSDAFADTFKTSNRRIPFIRSKSSAFWVRFKVTNRASINRWVLHWFFSSYLPDSINLYVADNLGNFWNIKRRKWI